MGDYSCLDGREHRLFGQNNLPYLPMHDAPHPQPTGKIIAIIHYTRDQSGAIVERVERVGGLEQKADEK